MSSNGPKSSGPKRRSSVTRRAMQVHPTTPAPAIDTSCIPIMRGRPSAPLGRMEALVLSKVDGRSSTGELALQVDLRAPELDAILARLVELGAIELLTSDAAAKASVGADGFRSLDDGWDDPAAGTQGADIFNQTTSPDLRAQDED